MGVIRLEEGMGSCTVCSRPASTQCRRCRRQLCRAHAPPVADECCDPCEAEYRPLSVENLAIRLGMSTTATLAGALFGLVAALIAGSIVFLQDPVRVRVLAMAAAMMGTVVGFGIGNVAASAVIRARFMHEQPSGLLPRARIVRRLRRSKTLP